MGRDSPKLSQRHYPPKMLNKKIPPGGADRQKIVIMGHFSEIQISAQTKTQTKTTI